jgi:hypothetical protein
LLLRRDQFCFATGFCVGLIMAKRP